MNNVVRSAVVLLVLAPALTGCNLARPRWFFPGDMQTQQSRATVHDPYGQPNLGPDVSDQVRPREFDRPAPQAVQAQPDARFWQRYSPW